MTKKEYAQMIIDRYKDDNHIQSNEELNKHIYSSSSLAIAMEFLGLLDKDELKYSKTRGGIIEIYCYKDQVTQNSIIRILSVRDMLDILPDKISENEDE